MKKLETTPKPWTATRKATPIEEVRVACTPIHKNTQIHDRVGLAQWVGCPPLAR